jgi:hypothetical protein
MDLSRDQLLEIDYFLIGGLYRSLGQEDESVAAAYALDFKQGDVVQPLIRNMGARREERGRDARSLQPGRPLSVTVRHNL